MLSRRPVIKLSAWILAFHKLASKVLYVHKVADAVLPHDKSGTLNISAEQSYASAGVTSEEFFRFIAFIRVLEVNEKLYPMATAPS